MTKIGKSIVIHFVCLIRIKSSNSPGRRSWRGRWTTKEWPSVCSTTGRTRARAGSASTRPTTSSCATVSTAFRRSASGPIRPHRPSKNNSHQHTIHFFSSIRVCHHRYRLLSFFFCRCCHYCPFNFMIVITTYLFSEKVIEC